MVNVPNVCPVCSLAVSRSNADTCGSPDCRAVVKNAKQKQRDQAAAGHPVQPLWSIVADTRPNAFSGYDVDIKESAFESGLLVFRTGPTGATKHDASVLRYTASDAASVWAAANGHDLPSLLVSHYSDGARGGKPAVFGWSTLGAGDSKIHTALPVDGYDKIYEPTTPNALDEPWHPTWCTADQWLAIVNAGPIRQAAYSRSADADTDVLGITPSTPIPGDLADAAAPLIGADGVCYYCAKHDLPTVNSCKAGHEGSDRVKVGCPGCFDTTDLEFPGRSLADVQDVDGHGWHRSAGPMTPAEFWSVSSSTIADRLRGESAPGYVTFSSVVDYDETGDSPSTLAEIAATMPTPARPDRPSAGLHDCFSFIDEALSDGDEVNPLRAVARARPSDEVLAAAESLAAVDTDAALVTVYGSTGVHLIPQFQSATDSWWWHPPPGGWFMFSDDPDAETDSPEAADALV